MSRHSRIVSSAVVFFAAAVWQPALAQIPTLHGVTGLQIEYKEPTNPAHRPMFDRLKRRGVLEQYREFMSPLRFRRALNVALQGCNGTINAFHQSGKITYCYEFLAETHRQVATTNVLPGFRREDAIVAGFVSTLLHETGHAIFYLFDVPIFGREEDAADAIAAYVALQFGPKTARRILTGTAFVWRAAELTRHQNRNRRFEDYADEHGTDAQRFFNTLCIALGSDVVHRSNVFSDFVPLLPERRRTHCGKEYLHVKNSFARFVLPHVDQSLMKKVQSREWLRSEDGSEINPPGPLGPGSSPAPNGPSGPSFGPSRPQPSAPR